MVGKDGASVLAVDDAEVDRASGFQMAVTHKMIREDTALVDRAVLQDDNLSAGKKEVVNSSVERQDDPVDVLLGVVCHGVGLFLLEDADDDDDDGDDGDDHVNRVGPGGRVADDAFNFQLQLELSLQGSEVGPSRDRFSLKSGRKVALFLGVGK